MAIEHSSSCGAEEFKGCNPDLAGEGQLAYNFQEEPKRIACPDPNYFLRKTLAILLGLPLGFAMALFVYGIAMEVIVIVLVCMCVP